MNQEIRNKLRNVVTQCRKLLEESIAQDLEGKFAIFKKKDHVTADPNAPMTHLTEEERVARKDILDHFEHIKARGFKPKDALDQLIREIAFTHLNRLCAYKMMEAREVYVGRQKFREAVSRGVNSNGVKFYLADHPEDERRYNTGQQDVAYRHFLDWLGGLLSDEIGVLFNPNDPANRLYPSQSTLDEVLNLLNTGGIKPDETDLREQWPSIWSSDETIGWVYQYFTPKELRDQARKESAAPRNSYELAFRNQFFTPRYVVEFLTDNTLGRIWYEMRKGETKLKDQCGYMVRRPTEIFLNEGEQPPGDAAAQRDDLSQEELLRLPVYVPHRPKKDPRDLRILDPASGSGQFVLYCFDLLQTIYEEAYTDPDLGPSLQAQYPTLDELRREVPRLILAHNLHGIDIDLRASQIAPLALWLRCQRAFQEIGLKRERPKITRSNFVCAEPMPGEEQMLKEFVRQEFTGKPERQLLGHLVEVVFEKMKLAGEAGSLLKIEGEIRETVSAARKQWVRETTQATDRRGQPLLFTEAALDRLVQKAHQQSQFDMSAITDAQFFEHAEVLLKQALQDYVQNAQTGDHLQRRLFKDDAEQGFAFVDLCLKHYDVVLMNPPFGLPLGNNPVTKYIAKEYPAIAKNLACAFIERALQLLSSGGIAGTVSDRAVFVRKNYEEIRRKVLSFGSLRYVDLGWNVLDEANVEASAIVMRRGILDGSYFIDVRKDCLKADQLRVAIKDIVDKTTNKAVFLHWNDEFLAFPNTAFAYWVPRSIFLLFVGSKKFGKKWAVTKQGTAPADTPRFVRIWWEVAIPKLADSSFARLAHGGSFSPVFRDYYFVIWWKNNGEDLKRHVCDQYPYLNGNPAWVVKNERDYFRPGLHFGKRCQCLSVQIMPSGMVFTNEGHAVFPINAKAEWTVCALMNTRLYRYIINTYCGQHKHGGYIDSLPSLHVPSQLQSSLAAYAAKEWNFRSSFSRFNETGNWFVGPSHAVIGNCETLTDAAVGTEEEYLQQEAVLLKERLALEEELAKVNGVIGLDWDTVTKSFSGNPFVGGHECPSAETDEADESHESDEDDGGAEASPEFSPEQFGRLGSLCAKGRITPEAITAERICSIEPELLTRYAHQELSYAMGVVFGRWDIRFATTKKQWPTVDKPFDPLPACPPGMLTGPDGFPLNETPREYTIRISLDGILPDDPEHPDDVERRVRDVVETIWNNRAEVVESEACDLLDVNTLREYLRRTNKGGFWEDHLSLYSTTRRKAPIYWLLQSSKRNYGLWLYYHKLDKDIFFKALVNYVEPKIRLESARLDTLSKQKAALGEQSKEGKRLAKAGERQEDFLSELKEFEDKLRRVANVNLQPDLNDGVLLNIALLHELVPWKEAEKYWEELRKGEYQWSSIGRQLRQKGLVR